MRRILLVALCAGLVACNSVEESPPPKSEPPPSIEALYDLSKDSTLTPYPSDRFTAPDATTKTGRRLAITSDVTNDPLITGYQLVADELNEMDGFSTSGGVILSFSGPIDIHGIVTDLYAEPPITDTPRDAAEYTKEGSPVYLVNVDEKSPERGRLHGLLPRWWAQAKDDYFPTAEYTLIVQPAEPLLPETRYLCVVTSALKAADGGRIGRSAETEKLLGGKATGEYAGEIDAALGELEKSTTIDRDDVVLATAFTTASVVDVVLATAKRARTAPPPAILSPWEIETPLQPDNRVRFKATFETPEYRRPKPDGKWQIEGGAPVEQKKVGLETFLAFADGTKSGPRPIVIFAHGLGGTKDGNWGTTERLASLGAAVIAIDSPDHGSRSDDPDASPIFAAFSFFGVDAETQSFDIGRARDNFRQMASDQLELVRLVDSLGTLDLLPVGAPDGVPDLDVSRILYIGHSFGSVQGATIFALAPEIKQAVWNVGGAGLMSLLRDSGTFSLLVNSLRPPHTPDGAIGRFFAITQGIVDPGDPLNYARFGALLGAPDVPGWTPRDVLIQEVIDDTIVPNSTSDALARAAGLVLIDPIRPISGLKSASSPLTGNIAGGATGVISQFDHMNGTELAQHGGLIFADEAIAQYVEFFTTGLAAGHATAPPAYPK